MTTPRASSEFNRGVHGLRGVAATMVLLSHVVGGAGEHVYTGAGYAAATTAFWNLGTSFVYLFFAISGYVIVPSVLRYQAGEFSVRRVVRIYPLFFVCTVAFIVLNAITHREPQLMAWETIVSAFLFTNLFTHTNQLTPNAWSLTYEMMFYAIAAVFCIAVHRRSLVAAVVAAGAFVAFLVSYNVVAFFLIGAAVYGAQRLGLVRHVPFRPVLEVLSAAGLAYAASLQHFEAEDMVFASAFPLMIFSALYFMLAAERDSLTTRLLSNRAAQHLGTISYSLYLIHPYTYLPIRLTFVKLGLFGDDPVLSMLVFGSVVVAVSIGLAQISYHLFERLPNELVFRRAPSRVLVADDPGPPDAAAAASGRAAR